MQLGHLTEANECTLKHPKEIFLLWTGVHSSATTGIYATLIRIRRSYEVSHPLNLPLA